MKCDVCFEDILSIRNALTHVITHQTQLLSLTQKLESYCIPAACESQAAKRATPNTINPENPVGGTVLTNGRFSHPAEEQTIKFRCPHKQCEQKSFSRKQDLVRHYATHYEYAQPCRSCQKQFLKALDFLNHRCTQPNNEQRELVRIEIARQLGLRRHRRIRHRAAERQDRVDERSRSSMSAQDLEATTMSPEPLRLVNSMVPTSISEASSSSQSTANRHASSADTPLHNHSMENTKWWGQSFWDEMFATDQYTADAGMWDIHREPVPYSLHATNK